MFCLSNKKNFIDNRLINKNYSLLNNFKKHTKFNLYKFALIIKSVNKYETLLHHSIKIDFKKIKKSNYDKFYMNIIIL